MGYKILKGAMVGILLGVHEMIMHTICEIVEKKLYE